MKPRVTAQNLQQQTIYGIYLYHWTKVEPPFAVNLQNRTQRTHTLSSYSDEEMKACMANGEEI